MEVKLGELKWTPLRVLKAKIANLGSVSIELDPAFIKQAGTLPGMEEYASQDDPSDQEQPEQENEEQNAESLAFEGMIVPFSVPDAFFGVTGGHEDDDDGVLKAQLEHAMCLWEANEKGDNDNQSECSDEEVWVAVSYDDTGNLICSDDTVEEAKPGKGLGYSSSTAWIDLQEKNLAAVPLLQGCGLCYNRRGYIVKRFN